jgi:hypothetical protein
MWKAGIDQEKTVVMVARSGVFPDFPIGSIQKGYLLTHQNRVECGKQESIRKKTVVMCSFPPVS